MFARTKRNIYAEEPVNSGRQNELDLAKCVVIFCMAIVHCIGECTPEEGLSFGIPYLFDTVIGGPLTAPLFMFAMGVGMAYSRRSTAKEHLRRGVYLIATNFALNIIRYLVPSMIGYVLTGDHNNYIHPLWYRFFENDILFFAGLAMICIALFLHCRLSDGIMLLISLGLSLLGTIFRGIDVGSPVGNILLGYLIGTEDAQGMVLSTFVLCNWLIIPVSGYIFGKRLRTVKDKVLFYRYLSLPCLLLAVAYFAVGIHYEFGMFGEGQNCFYHMITTDAAASICAALGILGIYYRLVRYLPQKALAVVQDISGNVNAIYCIHWVLIAMTVNVLLYVWRGTQELPIAVALLLGTVISLVSMWFAHLWKNWKKKKNIVREGV